MLCRDVYHCPPDVLYRQSWERVQAHILALEIETKVKRHKKDAARAHQQAKRKIDGRIKHG
jgi:hypothetical protein